MTSVCILDYGSGNVKSVFNLLKSIASNVVISNSILDIQRSSHIVLPGVGAFGAAMEKIRKTIPLNCLKEEVLVREKPFLGVCVGMQILADTGYEFGEHQGLGWIPGKVCKIASSSEPLPHIGWNDIQIRHDSDILDGLRNGEDFYFVHSYVFIPEKEEHILATTNYGQTFPCVIANKNVYGVQFHPEKSQYTGQLIMKNFLNLK